MQNLNNAWRKTASTLYKKPTDSKIFGSVDLDITDLQEYISQKRKEGLKITLTHFFTIATARAIKERIPELNTYIKRGNVVSYSQIDATISVLLRENEMGSVRVNNADKHSLASLVNHLKAGIVEAKKGAENNTMQMKDRLGSIPWPLRNMVYWFIRKLIIDLGLSLGSINGAGFGSYIVSNIGSLGLDNGYPALFPAANVSMVLIMGGVKKVPLIIKEEIKIRTVINLGAALDHRMVDASHAGLLFKYYKYIVANPHLLETAE